MGVHLGGSPRGPSRRALQCETEAFTRARPRVGFRKRDFRRRFPTLERPATTLQKAMTKLSEQKKDWEKCCGGLLRAELATESFMRRPADARFTGLTTTLQNNRVLEEYMKKKSGDLHATSVSGNANQHDGTKTAFAEETRRYFCVCKLPPKVHKVEMRQQRPSHVLEPTL